MPDFTKNQKTHKMETKTHKINIGDIANKIMQPIAQKQATIKKNSWKPKYSRFKLKIYFKDGNQKVFYSYDIFNRYESGIKRIITDEQVGIEKLFSYIASVQGSIKTACIWVTFQKEQGTDCSQYNFEVYKGINKITGWETPTNHQLHFANGFLNIDVLKLQAMQKIEGKQGS
jgi:hypothetical protein